MRAAWPIQPKPLTVFCDARPSGSHERTGSDRRRRINRWLSIPGTTLVLGLRPGLAPAQAQAVAGCYRLPTKP